MAKSRTKKPHDGPFHRVVARNKRARRDFQIEETLEAGIVLLGSEVKSLRSGQGSIREAYARIRNGEAWLLGAHIPEYAWANRFNHEPLRDRKLLLRAAELKRLWIKTARAGYTLVPLELYFDERGHVKVEIGLARGKRQSDRRQAIREADAAREMDRVMKRARLRQR